MILRRDFFFETTLFTYSPTFLNFSSFGSGFGLMEAGCDKEGYWRMLTSSLKWVQLFYIGFIPHVFRFRYTTMATHISWCLPWLRLFRRASALRGRNLGVISREIVMKRIEQGSKTKDILYHLVRYSSFIASGSILMDDVL